MSLSLHPKLLNLLAQHPELNTYRKKLLGHCCRAPNDVVLRARIEAFLVLMPRYRDVLGVLLEG